VKVATEQGADAASKPRPQALLSHDADKRKSGGSDSDSDDATADEDVDAGVYKPLKRTAVLFDDGNKTSKAEREEARRKARVAKSKLFKDLLDQVSVLCF
jgi:hypothetical protein